eukprot:4208830-Alexandrium_andersonii.AAC.1
MAAAATASGGRVMREESGIGALTARARMETKSSASSLALKIERGVAVGKQRWRSPFTVPQIDASCAPRRDGGSLESRGLVRAFEKLL